MGSEIQIRFRHTSGDVGPFAFPPSSTVLSLKERVIQEWQSGEPSCCTVMHVPTGLRNFTHAAAPDKSTHSFVKLISGNRKLAAGTQIDGETPRNTASLKLIFNGKFLEDNKSLNGP